MSDYQYQSFLKFCSDRPPSNRSSAEIAAELESRAHQKSIKRRLAKEARDIFNRHRASLALALLDGGQAYCCAWPGCSESTNLTVDHKIPLSRGGTDDIGNLQFLCRSHNSSKRDR